MRQSLLPFTESRDNWDNPALAESATPGWKAETRRPKRNQNNRISSLRECYEKVTEAKIHEVFEKERGNPAGAQVRWSEATDEPARADAHPTK